MYGLTRRGTIGLFVVCALVVTSLVLLVVALFGQGHDSKRLGEQAYALEALSSQNRVLIAGLEAEVERERSQAIQAADAYCRLKHYETLSGGAVLRIAAGFHLLSSRAQARWRVALERVAQIPAASSCAGTPVGLRRPSDSPEDRSLVLEGEALVAPSIGAPIVRRPSVHHPVVVPHHVTPGPVHPSPPTMVPIPSPSPSPAVPAPAPAPPGPTSPPPMPGPDKSERAHGPEQGKGPEVETEVGVEHGPHIHVGVGKGSDHRSAG